MDSRGESADDDARGSALLLTHLRAFDVETTSAPERLKAALDRELAGKLIFALAPRRPKAHGIGRQLEVAYSREAFSGLSRNRRSGRTLR